GGGRSLAGDSQRRPPVTTTGGSPARPQARRCQGPGLPEDALFEPMDRLLFVGSVPDAFDEGPEDGEGLVDVLGGALLLGGGVGGQLDGRCGVGEHERGSSPLRDDPGGRNHPGRYRRERAISNASPTPSKSLT